MCRYIENPPSPYCTSLCVPLQPCSLTASLMPCRWEGVEVVLPHTYLILPENDDGEVLLMSWVTRSNKGDSPINRKNLHTSPSCLNIRNITKMPLAFGLIHGFPPVPLLLLFFFPLNLDRARPTAPATATSTSAKPPLPSLAVTLRVRRPSPIHPLHHCSFVDRNVWRSCSLKVISCGF